MKITYCIMTLNRLHEVIQCIKRVRPYVDRMVVVDGGSTDDTILTLRNWDGIELYLHPWNDSFSGQRNNYLRAAEKNGGTDWILVSDPDELFSEESCKNMRSEIDKIESSGSRYNMIAFESHSVTLKGNVVANHREDKYWKPLLFKWNEGIHYIGNPHETLIIDKGPRIYNSKMFYYHIKQDKMTWHRGYRNFHIGGGGPNLGNENKYWVSYKDIVTSVYGKFPSWGEMEKILLAGNIDSRIKDWMFDAKNANGFDGASEVRESYKTYFRIMHPEEERSDMVGVHIE